MSSSGSRIPGAIYDPGVTDDEILVGGSTFTSGPAAVYGEQIAVGFQAGINYINLSTAKSASRAREIGLVQEVVPAGQSLGRAEELAERIAAYPQASLRADRASAIAALGQSLPDGFAGEESLGLASLADPEIGEALARYASGDRPEPPVPAG